MDKENEKKVLIQEKLKEMMKLAKEICILSKEYMENNQLEPDYMMFNEYSSEMKMLKNFFENYEIKD